MIAWNYAKWIMFYCMHATVHANVMMGRHPMALYLPHAQDSSTHAHQAVAIALQTTHTLLRTDNHGPVASALNWSLLRATLLHGHSIRVISTGNYTV